MAERLVKVYRSRKNEVRALDGLDLTVEEVALPVDEPLNARRLEPRELEQLER